MPWQGGNAPLFFLAGIGMGGCPVRKSEVVATPPVRTSHWRCRRAGLNGPAKCGENENSVKNFQIARKRLTLPPAFDIISHVG